MELLSQLEKECPLCSFPVLCMNCLVDKSQCKLRKIAAWEQWDSSMHPKQCLYPRAYKLPVKAWKMQVASTTLKRYIDQYCSHWRTLLYMCYFIGYTFLLLCRMPLCSQNSLNSLQRGFSKKRETFLRDSGPCWYDSIPQLLQICWLLIHAYLLFHIPIVLYWLEIH